jgi:hypothetical protein
MISRECVFSKKVASRFLFYGIIVGLSLIRTKLGWIIFIKHFGTVLYAKSSSHIIRIT